MNFCLYLWSIKMFGKRYNFRGTELLTYFYSIHFLLYCFGTWHLNGKKMFQMQNYRYPVVCSTNEKSRNIEMFHDSWQNFTKTKLRGSIRTFVTHAREFNEKRNITIVTDLTTEVELHPKNILSRKDSRWNLYLQSGTTTILFFRFKYRICTPRSLWNQAKKREHIVFSFPGGTDALTVEPSNLHVHVYWVYRERVQDRSDSWLCSNMLWIKGSKVVFSMTRRGRLLHRFFAHTAGQIFRIVLTGAITLRKIPKYAPAHMLMLEPRFYTYMWNKTLFTMEK